MAGRHVRMSVRWAFNFRAWAPSAEDWTVCNQCVQPEEAQRISKFVFKKDAKSSMIGRLMIRKVISEYLNIPFKEVTLARSEKGKPYIADRTDVDNFSFNVSHQGDYAVLAAQGNCILGVDVMKLETRTDVDSFFETMRRQFTAEEWMLIRSPTTDKERLKLFFRLWCLKESYVKALGVGIGFEVGRLNFNLPTLNIDSSVISDTTLKIAGTPMPDWTFEEQLLGDHSIAVAVNENDKTRLGCPVNKNMEEGLLSAGGEFKVLDFRDVIKNVQSLSEPDMSFWENFHVKAEDPSQWKSKKAQTS
ncbi:L-aminoadipate-semialdehyde dehydrogenase-phosphopantetheinyl transferase-like [Mizuhopecten yessoensis]|uniref:L-aminoadipate-semialdehyde dehydrogenase-phosphopantetheinyl transferase n=1 Tax=Mizuhopecten yessoensis TaxID=6573 RepID=A0A210QE83_MIZYE|nr:L-aminoadipate-semialdehyde dehydrogenase-phosphopantetheinyl transferase-like [Mizuhopecten yessoensis]XP_021360230.1 L-aminoadipate-semialdehyde dehydrogenase-phosphopantetheinyl transferase-like [Mizuhopecten yessoensis]OWF47055.1 L-aminoadipate-semialdehyde dehydrogenase-phosphopantetheinyl transferase [Mizuhopecten yessoensis]